MKTAKEYWTKQTLHAIEAMLNPRSIAVIGASENPGYGLRLLNAVLSSRQRPRVYPVNPNYNQINGLTCYASVADVPEPPDLVALIVPSRHVLPTLRMSHAKGARAAIVISAGFAEKGTEDGLDLQRAIGEFGRESGMRVCGPNCLGVANVTAGMWATATSGIPSALPGSIGLVCQSGATAFGPFMFQARDGGFGFSHIISTGNEADLDFTDYARYLLDDEATLVIGGYVEGFRDVSKLIALAQAAAERKKPLVIIKIGRSDIGTRSAKSHTAALTGSDKSYDALFRQYGIIRVDDYSELLEVANLLADAKRPRQRGIAVVSHSGGIGSSLGDILGYHGLDVPPLSAKALAAMEGILDGRGSAGNPADVTGLANSGKFPYLMDCMINEPEVGTLVVASLAAGNRITQAEQVIALHTRSEKRLIYLWTASRLDDTGLTLLKRAGVPVFYSPANLARALQKAFAYHGWLDACSVVADAGMPTPRQRQSLEQALGLGRSNLSEAESKRLISAWGIPVTREIPADSPDSAVAAAQKIGFPVVVKVNSPDIPHKTEAGAIRIGLRDADEVRTAYEEIVASAKRYAPSAVIEGVLVQEMVDGGTEVIVGVSYDSQAGPMLLFGIGGIMVEIYNDVALRHCPIGRDQAMSMIAEVKGAGLLQAFRGRPATDIDALAEVLVCMSQMAVHLEGRLGELDINPLVVFPKGRGVKAVDALVQMLPGSLPDDGNGMTHSNKE